MSISLIASGRPVVGGPKGRLRIGKARRPQPPQEIGPGDAEQQVPHAQPARLPHERFHQRRVAPSLQVVAARERAVAYAEVQQEL